MSVEGEAEAKNLSQNKELEDISEVWSSSSVTELKQKFKKSASLMKNSLQIIAKIIIT